MSGNARRIMTLISVGRRSMRAGLIDGGWMLSATVPDFASLVSYHIFGRIVFWFLLISSWDQLLGGNNCVFHWWRVISYSFRYGHLRSQAALVIHIHSTGHKTQSLGWLKSSAAYGLMTDIRSLTFVRLCPSGRCSLTPGISHSVSLTLMNIQIFTLSASFSFCIENGSLFK